MSSNDPARGRIALAGLVVFLLIQASEVALHRFVLAGDDRPFYGRLLQDAGGQDAARPFLFPSSLVVKQLAWTFVVVIAIAVAANAMLQPRAAARA
jgi:hypothetical protein